MRITRQFKLSAALLAALISANARSIYADGPPHSPEKEAELIAVLQSEAPAAEKAITCKLLAIYGSSTAVPELAKLLPNEQLSSWARIALEAIPGTEADEALRKATDSLQGELLIGTINSIGVRRIASATDQLSVLIGNKDTEVALASAVALGRIGNDAAAKTLHNSLATAAENVRTGVAEGCVLCAERFAAEGRGTEAINLYDEVRKSQVPTQRRLEATRGAILARKDQGIPLLLEQFRSPDKVMFQLALGTAREFPGNEVDKALAKELSKATPERAALIVGAMADRKDTVQLAAVQEAAGSGPKLVRLAAIEALGSVGNTSCLSLLLKCAIEKDEQIITAAKASLAKIPGESIDKEVVSRLAKPEPAAYPVLLELVGQRRIQALPALLKAVDDSDKSIRTIALTSLGATVPPDKLAVLIKQVVSPKTADDAPAAELALKTACVRMPDREACSTELAAALASAKVPTKVVLLKILGAVGGTKSLQTLAAAAKDENATLQDVSSEVLGEWMTIDAAPILLDLSQTAPAEKFQIRAMRAYIKVVRQFAIPDENLRIEMCEKAFNACHRPAEQKLVLDVLKRYPNLPNMKLAIKATQIPELKEDASQATLQIAAKIINKTPEAKDLLASIELPKVKVEILKAEYGAGAKQKDVTEIVQKQATDVALVSLGSDSYNEVFGGDPAPDTPKQLKIRYKLNDKQGEATFPENTMIILPTPK